jgi:uncharacterized protein YbjT (DUF2867 family)
MYLVTGATGNVGSEVVAALAAAGQPVRALVRKPRGDTPGQVAGNLDDPASLRPALEGVSGMFLLPGYDDMPAILAEAVRAGVGKVVLLSGSSAPSGDRSNAVSAYMIRSEEAVKDAGVAWTILQPSAFMANALRWRDQILAGTPIRVTFPDAAAALVDPADIGAVAAIALTSDTHAGRTYRLTGPEALRPAEQIARLSAGLGRDIPFVELSEAEAREELHQTMPAPYAEAFINFYFEGALDESPVLPTVAEVTGRAPGTFEAWIAAHRDQFA